MRIGVVVAFWRREAIAWLMLRRLANAARGHDVTIAAVTDEEENGRAAEMFGCEVVKAQNSPLSNKHNAGAAHLRGRVDAIVVLGSDNWVCDRFFGVWQRELSAAPIVGVTDSWQVCVHRPEALYYPGYTKPHRRGETLGAARGLRADVLDRLDWQPWLIGKERGLDWSMRQKLRGLGYDTAGRKQAELGVRMIGVKSDESLTKVEKFMAAPGSVLVEREEALRPFPQDECAALESLRTGG